VSEIREFQKIIAGTQFTSHRIPLLQFKSF
jgi:hypothetical protein